MNNVKYFTIGKCGYSTNRSHIGAWIEIDEQNYNIIKAQMDGILESGFEKNKNNFIYHIIEVVEKSKIQIPHSNGLMKHKVTELKIIIFDTPSKFFEFKLFQIQDIIPVRLYHKNIYIKESN